MSKVCRDLPGFAEICWNSKFRRIPDASGSIRTHPGRTRNRYQFRRNLHLAKGDPLLAHAAALGRPPAALRDGHRDDASFERADNDPHRKLDPEGRRRPGAARVRPILGLTHLSNYLTLKGSFSAVSKPNFASKYALESSRRDLQNALIFTVL